MTDEDLVHKMAHLLESLKGYLLAQMMGYSYFPLKAFQLD